MSLRRMLPILLILQLGGIVFAGQGLDELAEEAVFGNSVSSPRALSLLRAENQKGLDALFNRFGKEIDEYRSTGQQNGTWRRISAAIDAVSKQRDGYSSRLFWHTDLEAAKRDSKATGRPVLSLRLLGNLDEELSCANSRFFRSVLYSDPSVADILRRDYVLHWQSVRPAPKITIDFGDGRKLVRTVTGNSVHYILDKEGRIVDVLPGLYSPRTFSKYLVNAKTLHAAGLGKTRALDFYWFQTAASLISDWELKLASIKSRGLEIPANTDRNEIELSPTALEAAPRAVTKAALEMPTVLALLPRYEHLIRRTENPFWQAFSDLSDPVDISAESTSFMRKKTANLNDSQFSSLMAKLRRHIAHDTLQNEYRFHVRILTWLNAASAADVETFNKRVYSDLFGTPETDPWLGLYEPDIYAAIDNSGIR